jgi:exodeoxyribonuclease-3
MKLVSWNVNGLRACLGKGFEEAFAGLDADVFCVQETKLQREQLNLTLEGYHMYLNSAEKKGYSGTGVFSRMEPREVTYGIGIPEHDREGRVITCSYEGFHLVNCYTPNSQDGLKRLAYRMEWEEAFRAYLRRLGGDGRPVILCGDLNVAAQPIDLKNPESNRRNAGFTDEERAQFALLLESGFCDTFRLLYPDTVRYSWWSYRFRARERDAGWRIDYFLISQDAVPLVREAAIHTGIFGSDHCPVSLEVDL